MARSSVFYRKASRKSPVEGLNTANFTGVLAGADASYLIEWGIS